MTAESVRFNLLVNQPGEPKPRPFRSTIPALRNLDYVGREEKFGEIAAALGDPAQDRVVVLHGPAGVGKSELALEYARRNAGAYPGGTFRLDGSQAADGSPTGLIVGLALLGQTVLGLDVPADMPIEKQAARAFQMLGAASTLLVYDNVGAEPGLLPWLPPHGMPCHVIATSVRDGWPSLGRPIAIDPLSEDEALRIVAAAAGPKLARDHGPELVRAAGGLAVQLVPSARTLLRQAERGRIRPAVLAQLADATKGSFSAVYGVLGESARLLLHAAAWLDPQLIPETELRLAMERGAGWGAETVDKALDECQDLHVLQGVAELRMHQLFARFVAERAPAPEIAAALPGILAAQAGRLVEIAQELVEYPNQPDTAARLGAYTSDPVIWNTRKTALTALERVTIGGAFASTGRFGVARKWYESAVALHDNNDLIGHLSNDEIVNCIHQIGYCFSSEGQFREAIPWLMRAADQISASIYVGNSKNNEQLGASQHEIGYCFSQLDSFDEAGIWFRRAIRAKRLGNSDQLVDHSSIGLTIRQIGHNFNRQKYYDRAIIYLQKAITEVKLGDVYERINHGYISSCHHDIGYAYLAMNDIYGALKQFMLAVNEAKSGDIHGRIDYTGLGTSYYQAAHCLTQLENFEAALPWFERAVAAAESGDVHGRVDRAFLAASLRAVADCLRQLGREDEAGEWERRADEVGS